MKRTIPFLILLASSLAFSQATRVDLPLLTTGPNVPASALSGPMPQALFVSNSKAYLCTHPSASLSACQASPLTTYTDVTEGTPCAPTTQLVQLPGSTCTASTGVVSNLGAWVGVSTFDYFVVTSYGTFGPFTWASSTVSFPAGPAFAVNFANSSATNFQGDSQITINPTTHTFTAPNIVLGSAGSRTLPLCGNGAGGALTTSGCTGGSASNPAGPAFAVNFANSGVTNFQGDSSITINPTSHTFNTPIAVTQVSPRIDIRSYGAVVDGATPIDSALNSAITAANSASSGAASPVVFLPCAPPGCFLSNGSGVTTLAAGTVKVVIQGTLTLGSTLSAPQGVTFECEGSRNGQQFQYGYATCAIAAPAVRGAIGTAVVSTNTPVTITPTFAGGTIANMHINSAITVAETMTCTAGTVTRTTDPSSNVSVPLTGACRIPAGVTAVIASCSDSSVNGTWMVIQADYPAQTMNFTQTGGATTATGCTVTGLNEDSFETARVLGVSGSDLSLVFMHTHPSTALWGMVAIAPPASTFSNHNYQGMQVTGNYGAGFWGEHLAFANFRGVGFGEVGYMTSIPMEMASSWWFTMDHSSLVPTLGHACTNNCGPQGYPFGLRCTASNVPVNGANDGACEFSVIRESTIGGGVKVDSNGRNQVLGIPALRDSILEQTNNNGIQIDARFSGTMYQPPVEDQTLMQDNFMNYVTSWIGCEDFNTCGAIPLTITGIQDLGVHTIGNKYYNGVPNVQGLSSGGTRFPTNVVYSRGVVYGQGIVSAEIEGSGASLGPSVIPHATATVTTAPGSWSCTFGSGGSLTTGVSAPDGTATAGEVIGGATASNCVPWSSTQATATGDRIIMGAWVNAGTNALTVSSPFGGPLIIQTFGADTLTQNATSNQILINGNWWHVVVTVVDVTAGSATPHALQMRMYGGASGVGNQYWSPFLIYVNASENIPDLEIERWRQQLLHATVPSNWNHPGVAVTTETIAAPSILPTIIYSAAGTALPSCASGIKGQTAIVSDATAPTYLANYTSGGAVVAPVMCNGTNWVTP